MIDLFEEFDGSSAAKRHLMEGIDAHVASVNASRQRGDVSLVGRVEDEVRAAPRRRIRFDDRGDATIYAVGRTFRGGRFEVPPLCALRARAIEARERAGRPAARVRLRGTPEPSAL